MITGPRDARGRPVLVYCKGSGRSMLAGACSWCGDPVAADDAGRAEDHDRSAPTR
jgi:hypothetical protein